MPNMRRYLKVDHILPDIKTRRKVGAIRELVALLGRGPEVPDPRLFLSVLIQEEARVSSVVEYGVALTHCRNDAVEEPVICLGVCREGIVFDGVDEVVRILVVIGWPTRHEQIYLRMVAELARLLREQSVRDRMLKAETAEEILNLLC